MPFTGESVAPRFRIDAKAVVLAAGCMATPVLLQQSGDLANASGAGRATTCSSIPAWR